MFNPQGTSTRTGGSDAATDAAARVENGEGRGQIVIACDHASNHVPARFRDLGLAPADLLRHIAWDPGALGVSRSLARRLDAPLVLSCVSRLVLDCNREPGVFDSIPAASEDTPIPGNAGLTEADRAWRAREVYEPFHAALTAIVAARSAVGPVAVVSVHSFTPVYRGTPRPWHVGILFDRDRRLSQPILQALRRETGLVVGENQPYSPDDRVYHTLDRHAQSRGLPSVMVEIRNDLVATPEAEEAWGERLADVIADALPGALEQGPGQPADRAR
ncbi:N-formylglutamate amidohydrolase [Labrys wisconsinensis]|uniref:N-formylglutamate amidohydrolase n=1 Tax=Labrys wisconsinensis TaxID=425677 RepID=A0ABU0J946_9HYPH|nr:N-formylglutamate amidohydrolase [Labrys wisconsinensis]MDQ0470793.1 putative N-formylglutamate amidohydrolase [Labrys wisconsinensis]